MNSDFTFVDYKDTLVNLFGYYQAISFDDVHKLEAELHSRNSAFKNMDIKHMIWGEFSFCLYRPEVEEQKLLLSVLDDEGRSILLHPCVHLYYKGDEAVIKDIISCKNSKTFEIVRRYLAVEDGKDRNRRRVSERHETIILSEAEMIELLHKNRLYLAQNSSSNWLVVYFLENGRLKRETYKSVNDDDRTGINVEIGGKLFYQTCRKKFSKDIPKRRIPSYQNFWSRIYRYCRNMTLHEIKQYFNEHVEQFIYEPRVEKSPFENEKITRIAAPDIIRYMDNPNKKTFDKIRVEIFLTSMNRDELISYYKENKAKLLGFVYDKIESSKNYQKYGIPVQFLKLYSVGIGSASTLVFDFELKTIPDEDNNFEDSAEKND